MSEERNQEKLKNKEQDLTIAIQEAYMKGDYAGAEELKQELADVQQQINQMPSNPGTRYELQ